MFLRRAVCREVNRSSLLGMKVSSRVLALINLAVMTALRLVSSQALWPYVAIYILINKLITL